MKLIDDFYKYARENIYMRAFMYQRAAAKGAGNLPYPATWVDDPITGGINSGQSRKVVSFTVNVDVLAIPETEGHVLYIQNFALLTALAYAERLKQDGHELQTFSFITLRDYYDDKAAGVRATYVIHTRNTIDLCAAVFDPDKDFTQVVPLPVFSIENPEGCAVFSDSVGLPIIDL